MLVTQWPVSTQVTQWPVDTAVVAGTVDMWLTTSFDSRLTSPLYFHTHTHTHSSTCCIANIDRAIPQEVEGPIDGCHVKDEVSEERTLSEHKRLGNSDRPNHDGCNKHACTCGRVRVERVRG